MTDSLKFYELHHLREAWLEVQRKGAHGGVDRVSVDEFARQADKHLAELSEALEQDRYVPEPYQRVYMRQPGKSEPRPLGLPTVRDKVVQMAVRNAIEPIFNAVFKDCSYAYRPRKGHRKAIRRVEHYLGTGNVWVTTCDIDQFFDSLDHQILLELVEERVKDPRVLRLIALWLKIGIVHKEEYRDVDRGVPQGGVISPLLSNIYLHPFDEHLVSRRFNLVRYADDFIILQRTSREAEKAHDTAKAFLESRLKLRLNPVKRKVWHVKSGFVFLGIHFKGYRRTISEEKFEKARAKIQHVFEKKQSLAQTVTELNESIVSWRHYYGSGDVREQFAQLEHDMQVGLATLVQAKTKTKKASEAHLRQDLQRLDFLLPKSQAQRDRFTKEVLTGAVLRRAAVKPAAAKEQPPQEAARRGKARARRKPKKPVSETSIKRAISRKKKQYQRRQAQSRELIVTRSGVRIGKLYQRIVVRDFKGTILQQVPHMKLKHILVMSTGVSLSSDVIRLCARQKIPIDFTDYQARPIARLSHPDFPRKAVGLAQLQAFTNGKAEILAKTIVEGKVRNQLNLVKYFHKYRKGVDPTFDKLFQEEEARMEGYLAQLDELKGNWSLEANRGKLFAIEGNAGSSYWRLIRELVKDEVKFERRVHQGATDLFNNMLNYGYGILYSRVWGAILRAGLNPMISFLHGTERQSPSLVYDLIEEFRPQAVDRVLVSLVGRGERLAMAGKFLDGPTKKKVLRNILERLHLPIKFRKYEMSLAEIIKYQAEQLAKYLQNQIPRYWPFIGKW